MSTERVLGGGFRRSGEVLEKTVMAIVEAHWCLPAALSVRHF